MLPSEARDLLGNKTQPPHQALLKELPFEPVKYKQMPKPASCNEEMIENRYQNPEIPSNESMKENERMKVLPEDSTDERIQLSTEKEENSSGTDSELTCAELFQKSAVEGFIGDDGITIEIIDDVCPNISPASHKMDDGVKGQTLENKGDISNMVKPPISDCKTVILQKSTSDFGTGVSDTSCLSGSRIDKDIVEDRTCNVDQHCSRTSNALEDVPKGVDNKTSQVDIILPTSSVDDDAMNLTEGHSSDVPSQRMEKLGVSDVDFTPNTDANNTDLDGNTG